MTLKIDLVSICFESLCEIYNNKDCLKFNAIFNVKKKEIEEDFDDKNENNDDDENKIDEEDDNYLVQKNLLSKLKYMRA